VQSIRREKKIHSRQSSNVSSSPMKIVAKYSNYHSNERLLEEDDDLLSSLSPTITMSPTVTPYPSSIIDEEKERDEEEDKSISEPTLLPSEEHFISNTDLPTEDHNKADNDNDDKHSSLSPTITKILIASPNPTGNDNGDDDDDDNFDDVSSVVPLFVNENEDKPSPEPTILSLEIEEDDDNNDDAISLPSEELFIVNTDSPTEDDNKADNDNDDSNNNDDDDYDSPTTEAGNDNDDNFDDVPTVTSILFNEYDEDEPSPEPTILSPEIEDYDDNNDDVIYVPSVSPSENKGNDESSPEPSDQVTSELTKTLSEDVVNILSVSPTLISPEPTQEPTTPPSEEVDESSLDSSISSISDTESPTEVGKSSNYLNVPSASPSVEGLGSLRPTEKVTTFEPTLEEMTESPTEVLFSEDASIQLSEIPTYFPTYSYRLQKLWEEEPIQQPTKNDDDIFGPVDILLSNSPSYNSSNFPSASPPADDDRGIDAPVALLAEDFTNVPSIPNLTSLPTLPLLTNIPTRNPIIITTKDPYDDDRSDIINPLTLIPAGADDDDNDNDDILFQPMGYFSEVPSHELSDRQDQSLSASPATLTPSFEPVEAQTNSSMPTEAQTEAPTFQPTETFLPTEMPTQQPTDVLTMFPTSSPVVFPSFLLTALPTGQPTSLSTPLSTSKPTETSSAQASKVPSQRPTESPTKPTPNTEEPSRRPTESPTKPIPNTLSPSLRPSARPTPQPTSQPTLQPSTKPPTIAPSYWPSASPSLVKSQDPTPSGTLEPTMSPQPSMPPTISYQPTDFPTDRSSAAPSISPSQAPSPAPSTAPSLMLQIGTVKQAQMRLIPFPDKELDDEDESVWKTVTEAKITQHLRSDVINPPMIVVDLTANIVRQVNESNRRFLQQFNGGDSSSLLITFNVSIAFRSEVDDYNADQFVYDAFDSLVKKAEYIIELQEKSPTFDDVQLVQVTVQGYRPSPTETPTLTPILAPALSPIQAPTQAPPQKDKIGMAVIVGVSVFCAALIILIILLFLRRRSGKNISEDDENENEETRASPNSKTVKVSTEILVEPQDDVSTLGDPMFGQGGMIMGLMDKDEVTASVGDDYDYTKQYRNTRELLSVAGTTNTRDRITSEDMSKMSSVQSTSIGKLGKMGGNLFADDASFEEQFSDPEERFDVVAPAGKLGMVIDTPNGGIPVVHAIKETSVLADQARVGDRLLSVDGEDCTGMTAMQVSKLISLKSEKPARVLVFTRSIANTTQTQ